MFYLIYRYNASHVRVGSIPTRASNLNWHCSKDLGEVESITYTKTDTTNLTP